MSPNLDIWRRPFFPQSQDHQEASVAPLRSRCVLQTANVEAASGEGVALAVPRSTGCAGSIRYQPTRASAAAWRGFMRSIYQNVKSRNSDLADGYGMKRDRRPEQNYTGRGRPTDQSLQGRIRDVLKRMLLLLVLRNTPVR